MKAGSSFVQWNSAPDGLGAYNYTPDQQVVMFSDLYLYAQWTGGYVVSYDGNGNDGGTPPGPVGYNPGDTVTVEGSGSLTKTGYTFSNWSTSINGVFIQFLPGQTFTMPSHSVELSAVWTAPFGVEICTDGVDNDNDGFIDCADQDCSTVDDALVDPQICTGSPIRSSTCVISYTHTAAGVITTNYNTVCQGQILTVPPTGDNYFYYSHGKYDDQATGVCCQVGTYAIQDPDTGAWRCDDSTACGLGTDFPCLYDFDYTRDPWLNSVYTSPGNKWCVSKYPFYFNPDNVASESSAGCCLMVQNGEVGYYTADGNVKIFGTS